MSADGKEGEENRLKGERRETAMVDRWEEL